MAWELPALGAVPSILLMLLLATKWKLFRPHALAGATAAVIGAAFPFLWIYPLLPAGWGLAVGVFGQIALALILGVSMILMRFWRDPERVPPGEHGVVVSAADGKVIYVWSVDEASTPLVTKGGRDYPLRELTGTSQLASDAYVIGVEMTFLDVHVTRCPVAGRVELQKHLEGTFISLGKDEAPFVNERLTTVIQGPSLTVSVVQVASRLVRRVQSYLTTGERVNAGQRLGMIRFGSLVAVVLPQREDVKIEAQLGDRVTAGVTVLARYELTGRRRQR